MAVKDVEIGFAEECEPWRLVSHFFPSKIGGKPAWLDLEHLPSSDTLECGVCHKQLIFMCQVYAPYEDEDNFHRTLFIFICKRSTCMESKDGNTIKVFRSHLPKENKFYSSEQPEEIPNFQFKISEWVKLCKVCGCQAQKHCSKCKEVYCCRDHQVNDWKANHKSECGNANLQRNTQPSNLLFPEFELLIEPEFLQTTAVDETEQLEEFNKLQVKGETGTLSHIPDFELESHIAIAEDKAFTHFQKRVEQAPDQVIRYQRGGEPLWIAKEPIPDAIPNCEYCQGPRQFEFQIMPQMLIKLKESQLDWGVLCVYTCKNSCTDVHCYKNEFVFKQDVSP